MTKNKLVRTNQNMTSIKCVVFRFFVNKGIFTYRNIIVYLMNKKKKKHICTYRQKIVSFFFDPLTHIMYVEKKKNKNQTVYV